MARNAASGRVASTRTNSILFNGGFESAPSVLTAGTTTANRWIDGTASGSNAATGLKWGSIVGGANGPASFDNTVSHSGTYSMKLDVTSAGATCVVASYKTSTPLTRELFLLAPNTSYTLTGWLKTSNVVTNAAFIDLREYNGAVSTLATTSSNKLSGTNNWTQVSLTVTTNASTVFGSILIRNNIAGNVSTVWADDILLIPATIGRVAASGRVAS